MSSSPCFSTNAEMGRLSVSDLSFAEKVKLLSGKDIWNLPDIPRLGLPSITVSDGPHGVRKPLSDLSLQEAHPATCFPAGCAVASSWDPKLVHQMGRALSKECELYQISVLLGPAMNLKRHPAGGRNLEYYSEDPFLTGTLAAAYVQGVQSSGNVGACVKHFAVNNQESHRFVVNAVVDERSLRELYLKSFHMAITQSKPAMLMGAYNRLNGIYCCENPHLLQTILRDEWKYQGVCVTDWGATNDRVAAVNAGLDLEMPGNHGVHNRAIYKAWKEGDLSEAAIDQCAGRVLDLMKTYGFNARTTEAATPEYRQTVFETNHRVAYDIAVECVVLLKNDHDLLPLAPDTHVAVIGEFAKDSRYQGMGSSHCTPTQVSHVFDEMNRYTSRVEYAAGYDANADDDVIQQDLLDEAKAVAERCDVVLLFLGLPEIMESEGFDREDLRLPKQHLALIESISEVNNNAVVVLSNGGAVELPKSISKVPSILEGYLLGQAGGTAIADLIFGKVSPSGRLPETFPAQMDMIPASNFFPGTRDTVEYREGLNVGYRYFDSLFGFQSSAQVRYPFGHGLTYSQFEYSRLRVDVTNDQAQHKQVKVEFRLTNTGQVPAKEVPQCYVAPLEASVHRPSHELKDFTKIRLLPGESRDVSFDLNDESFSYYDLGACQWIVESGAYEIQIGKSSQDIELKQKITFHTGIMPSDAARKSGGGSSSTDDMDFAKRFGAQTNRILDDIRKRKEPRPISKLDRNSLMKEAASHSMIGRLLLSIIFKVGCKEIKAGPTKKRETRMVRANVENLPLRALVLFAKGALSMEFLDGLIATMNGELWKAACKLGEMTWCGIKALNPCK